MAKLLKGADIRAIVEEYVSKNTSMLKKFNKPPVRLAVVLVGNDMASSVYVRNKTRACERCGIECKNYVLDEFSSADDIIMLIKKLNHDDNVNGILLQLPLPEHLKEDEERILQSINPNKDVDGFCYNNVGKLHRGRLKDALIPCTAAGIMYMLKYNQIDIAGKHCVIVGRSNIVGKPLAGLMLDNDATVTVCHSKTENLKDVCKQADILVCAIGKPKFFDESYIKDGAVVIDVGINRDENGKLCGDVDFNSVFDKASAITPVPGGVGVLTVTELMHNCLRAWEIQHKRGWF